MALRDNRSASYDFPKTAWWPLKKSAVALSLCTIDHLKQKDVIGQTRGWHPSLPSLKEPGSWQEDVTSWKTLQLLNRDV